MVYFVFGLPAQQLVNLTLQFTSFITLDPFLPVGRALPGADDHELIGPVKPLKAFTGNITWLFDRKGSDLPEKGNQFSCFVLGDGSFDQYFNRHFDLLPAFAFTRLDRS
jgi:hypothetical protein